MRAARAMAAEILAILIAAALLAGCAAPAPKSPAPRVCFHADEGEKDVGYCQALRVGKTVYVSGITARGPMPEAVKSVYERLKKSLEAHGLTYADVVKENVYAVDLDAFIAARAIRRPYYGDTIPAATWVQVQRLYLPAFVLEVELVAEIPQ
jgi:2-iminobutanoate/2-iminopropanoate deaminase